MLVGVLHWMCFPRLCFALLCHIHFHTFFVISRIYFLKFTKEIILCEIIRKGCNNLLYFFIDSYYNTHINTFLMRVQRYVFFERMEVSMLLSLSAV